MNFNQVNQFNPKQTNFKPPISQEQLINQIDWESLSLEEILEILDRLGIGYYTTIQYLLKKLKSQKGGLSHLMKFIKALDIGKKGSAKNARKNLQALKKEKKLSKLLYWALMVLIARHEKKFQEKPNPFEDINLEFQPPVNTVYEY
jgi:hypothetical protein